MKKRNNKKQCRHCNNQTTGKICRQCYSKKHTGSVSRAYNRRKK